MLLVRGHARAARQRSGSLWSFRRWSSESPADPAAPPADGLLLAEGFVKRMLEIEREDGKKRLLRLTVDSGGCSGFQYNFSLDDSKQPEDRVFEREGATLVVDGISYDFVKGSTVDFTEELMRSSFMVTTNPNATAGCGCGASFVRKT